MKTVFQHTKNKSKHKIKFFSIKEEPGELLFFSGFDALNKKENLEFFDCFSLIGGDFGARSLCYKLPELVFGKNKENQKKNLKNFPQLKHIFCIDSDNDGMNPNIHTIIDNKKNIKFFFNCSGIAPSDFIDRMLKLKKKQKVSEFSIKDNNLVIFTLPDVDNNFCKSTFTQKEIKNFSSNFNNFIDDRVKKEKLLKFKVPNGKYVINTYWHYDVFGEHHYSGFDVVGHLIELKK